MVCCARLRPRPARRLLPAPAPAPNGVGGSAAGGGSGFFFGVAALFALAALFVPRVICTLRTFVFSHAPEPFFLLPERPG